MALLKGYYHRLWWVLLPFSELRRVECILKYRCNFIIKTKINIIQRLVKSFYYYFFKTLPTLTFLLKRFSTFLRSKLSIFFSSCRLALYLSQRAKTKIKEMSTNTRMTGKDNLKLLSVDIIVMTFLEVFLFKSWVPGWGGRRRDCRTPNSRSSAKGKKIKFSF